MLFFVCTAFCGVFAPLTYRISAFLSYETEYSFSAFEYYAIISARNQIGAITYNVNRRLPIDFYRFQLITLLNKIVAHRGYAGGYVKHLQVVTEVKSRTGAEIGRASCRERV